jgi:hypothetical protein
MESHFTLKPERLAELEEYASAHGQSPLDALDDLLAAQLAWERNDHEETVAAVLQANEDVKDGRTRSAEDVYEAMRSKHGF